MTVLLAHRPSRPTTAVDEFSELPLVHRKLLLKIIDPLISFADLPRILFYLLAEFLIFPPKTLILPFQFRTTRSLGITPMPKPSSSDHRYLPSSCTHPPYGNQSLAILPAFCTRRPELLQMFVLQAIRKICRLYIQ